MKILELTSDAVFKAFMLSEETKKYKTKLISEITGIKEEILENAKYTSKELKKNNKKEKTYKTDIIVTVEKSIINIEMNKDYYKGINNKNNQYINKIKSEIYDKGETYKENKKTIQINIDNYDQYKEKRLIYKFMIMEEKSHIIGDEYYEKYHINLDYFKNKCYTISELNELEKLCKLFVVETKEELNELKGEVYMEEAINELEKISSDEKIIGLYDKEKVEQKVLNTRLMNAKEEGKIEVAASLLKNNVDINIISKSTGLTIEEINELKETE